MLLLLTFQCLVYTKRSQILKQTCSFQWTTSTKGLKTKLISTEELNFKKNCSSKLFFKAIFSFSSKLNHQCGREFYITLDWRFLLFKICLVLQSGMSSFRERLCAHLGDKYCRLTLLVSFKNEKLTTFGTLALRPRWQTWRAWHTIQQTHFLTYVQSKLYAHRT